jgi:outer membrane protein TolC
MKIVCHFLFGLATAGALAFAARAAEPAAASTNAIQLGAGLITQMADEMRTNHPALQALGARARAAQHSTNAVRTWEDPLFKFGGVTASERGPTLHEDGDLLYALEQKLPLFGKAQAARTSAQADAEVENARQVVQFQTLRRDLAKALFELGRSDRLLELGREDLSWLESMVAVAEEQYGAGRGKQLDVLRLQNERSRRFVQLRSQEDQRQHQQLAINRLLHRELQAPLPRLLLPTVARPISYNPQLVDLASRFEPRLRLMEKETKQAEAALKAARKSRLPDVSAGIEGRQYSGDGGFREGTFLVSLSLPWLNRKAYRSEVARTEERLRASELEATDYRLTVQQEVHQLTVAIEAARREASLYADEILPRARLAVETASNSWQINQGPLTDLLEARRILWEAQESHARAVAQQYQAMSELVLCCGLGDLEALEAIGAAVP